jgi:hypothetical protein
MDRGRWTVERISDFERAERVVKLTACASPAP